MFIVKCRSAKVFSLVLTSPLQSGLCGLFICNPVSWEPGFLTLWIERSSHSVALDYLYLNSCGKGISDHVEGTVILTFVIATGCFS